MLVVLTHCGAARLRGFSRQPAAAAAAAVRLIDLAVVEPAGRAAIAAAKGVYLLARVLQGGSASGGGSGGGADLALRARALHALSLYVAAAPEREGAARVVEAGALPPALALMDAAGWRSPGVCADGCRLLTSLCERRDPCYALGPVPAAGAVAVLLRLLRAAAAAAVAAAAAAAAAAARRGCCCPSLRCACCSLRSVRPCTTRAARSRGRRRASRMR